MGHCCGGFGWGHLGGGMGILGLLLSLLIVAGLSLALGLGILWAVRTLRRRPVGAAPDVGMDPLEIARRRLARGEITLEEFEVIREHLQV